MSAPVTDPVCGMVVDPNQNELLYLEMHFAFCSRQCRERFLAHPHLYIGYPGRKAPKQEGVVDIKRRRLHLAAPLHPMGATMVADDLLAMRGIRNVDVQGERMEITYDLLEVSAEQIEKKLMEIGVKMGEGWPERLRRAFVHYAEECELGNLEVGEKHVPT
ncbi:MAG: YHS domain-containing protein [Gammaproteobacteria bacterium]|nr:YHS domain-containing protein [Gammaproteobacteria bacterium]